jgi:quinol monooxygenase YgiN
MYAVIVDLNIKPGLIEEFLPLVQVNAKSSVETEPGCRQFDVCLAENDPNLVLLYELYDDAAAFAAHMQTSHFKRFDAQSAEMIASKRVLTASRLPHAG